MRLLSSIFPLCSVIVIFILVNFSFTEIHQQGVRDFTLHINLANENFEYGFPYSNALLCFSS